MTYLQLSDLLSRLAEQTTRAEPHLSGAAAAEKAKKLGLAAHAFEKVVATALRGSDPAAQALHSRLGSAAALEQLTDALLPRLGTSILGKKFSMKKGESSAAARERLFHLIVENGQTEPALAALEQLLTPRTPAAPDDEQALRAELLRLGGLRDTEFDLEVQLHMDPETLSALIKLAGLKAPKRGPSKKNIADLRAFTRRLHENTLGWKS